MPLENDSFLPPLHTASDTTSNKSQFQFLLFTGAILVLTVVAAVGGAFVLKIRGSPIDWAGVVAAAGFFAAAAVKSYLLMTRPDRTWYKSRAAAESVKTLAWRYGVGAKPFDLSMSDPDPVFIARLHEVINELKGLSIEPSMDSVPQITQPMLSLRKSTLPDRIQAYETGRIVDQQDWYSAKAKHHRDRARRFQLATLTLEIGGGIAAIFKAASIIDIDILGIAAAGVAGLVAWEQARQDDVLGTAYSLAAQELAAVRALVKPDMREEDWAEFVDQAEEAISREHTLWRASRGS